NSIARRKTTAASPSPARTTPNPKRRSTKPARPAMPTLPRTAPPRALTHRLRFSSTAWACAVLALLPTTAHPDLPTELRIVTYNTRHGEGMDNKIDHERIAKVLNDQKPDIVALEEVDQGTKRASGVDQPAELAKLTGMKAYFGHNIDFDGGG